MMKGTIQRGAVIAALTFAGALMAQVQPPNPSATAPAHSQTQTPASVPGVAEEAKKLEARVPQSKTRKDADLQSRFEALDVNKDGVVSREEFAKLEQMSRDTVKAPRD